jgi:general secretion pathway protein G
VTPVRVLVLEKKLMKSKQSRQRHLGFTLIELLVVLVILGLLASVAGPKVIGYLGGAKSDTARLQTEEFGASLDLFKLETGRYPTTQEGLQGLVQQPPGLAGWNGPYLKKRTVPKDPWGNDYRYVSPGQHGSYDISSLGADNKDGGDGENKDILGWEDSKK